MANIDKNKIYEEEKARMEAQEKLKQEKKDKESAQGCFGCLGFILIIFLISSLSSCFKDEKEIPSSVASNLPAYEIAETKNIGNDRLRVNIVVKENVTAEQLKAISTEVVENLKKDMPIHAIAIFFNDYSEYIGSGASLGQTSYGPDGSAAYNPSVKSGDYSKMSFSYELKEKDWTKQLTADEVQIWSQMHQYYLECRKNNDNRSEDELKKDFSSQHNISIDKINSIASKQLLWSM